MVGRGLFRIPFRCRKTRLHDPRSRLRRLPCRRRRLLLLPPRRPRPFQPPPLRPKLWVLSSEVMGKEIVGFAAADLMAALEDIGLHILLGRLEDGVMALEGGD